MLFHNISPLGEQAQPDVFISHFEGEQDAGLFAEQDERWGFTIPVQARLRRDLKAQRQLGLPKRSPAALSVYI